MLSRLSGAWFSMFRRFATAAPQLRSAAVAQARWFDGDSEPFNPQLDDEVVGTWRDEMPMEIDARYGTSAAAAR